MAVPLLSRDGFFVDRIGRFLLLAVFAISVDLIWGYGGMFTFGQAAFFGGAGYVVGMLTTREGWILPLSAVGLAGRGGAVLGRFWPWPSPISPSRVPKRCAGSSSPW